MKNQLAHFDETGSAHMVDVSKKRVTNRIAIANCKVCMLPSTLKLIKEGSAKKGDVIGVARLAGIMAAKKTADIIPLCHPLPISKVSVSFLLNFKLSQIELQAIVKTTGKTGVEMEALTAVTVSALTIYDMLKSVDKNIKIIEVCLVMKDGGKSGLYKRNEEL